MQLKPRKRPGVKEEIGSKSTFGQFTKESSQIGYEADQPHTHISFQLCCVAISIMVNAWWEPLRFETWNPNKHRSKGLAISRYYGYICTLFPASLWFKAMENISHSKLIHIIMNFSLTLESVLAKEDVDHSHVFLPGIVGGWTCLGETQKRIRFFSSPSVWKFCCSNWYFVTIQKQLLNLQLAHISKDIFIRLEWKTCYLWFYHD